MKFSVLQTILTILAALSIPSIGYNIWLYRQNKRQDVLRAERDLNLKNIEFEEEMARGEIIINRSALAKVNENTDTFEDSKKRLRKIAVEIDYLQKVSGDQNVLLIRQSFWDKIDQNLNSLKMAYFQD